MAREARAKAEAMSDTQAIANMMEVAAMWDRMAEIAARDSGSSN
jgi:hypothetical protein